MPIEIKELVVRANITEHQGHAAGQVPEGMGSDSGQAGAGNHEDIVRDCVEQVLEILQQKKER